MSFLYTDKIAGVRERLTTRDIYWKSITAAERHAASTHCGPDESYPLGPGCAHVSAAFHLALSGHGHPSLSCIRNYARSHGCSIPPSQKAAMWVEGRRTSLTPW